METTHMQELKKYPGLELSKFKKSQNFNLKIEKYVKGHEIIVEPSLIDDVLVVKTNTIGAETICQAMQVIWTLSIVQQWLLENISKKI